MSCQSVSVYIKISPSNSFRDNLLPKENSPTYPESQEIVEDVALAVRDLSNNILASNPKSTERVKENLNEEEKKTPSPSRYDSFVKSHGKTLPQNDSKIYLTLYSESTKRITESNVESEIYPHRITKI